MAKKPRGQKASGNCWSRRNTPLEIWREIMCYLPVKALVRFRSVCKSWRSTIEESNFTSLHLQVHHHKNSNNLPMIVNEEYSKEWWVCCSKTFRRLSRIKSPPLDGRWDVVGERDGLLLFERFFDVRENERMTKIDDYTVILWNPSVQKSVCIPPPPSLLFDKDNTIDTILGFDPAENDYKLFNFVYNDDYGKVAVTIPPSFNVFSLKSRSWTEVSYSVVGKSPVEVSHNFMNNVSIGEYIHWTGRVYGEDKNHNRSTLVSLNLTKMTIMYTPMPDQLDNNGRFVLIGHHSFSRHPIIGLVTQSGVWILKELNPDISYGWNRMCEIELDTIYDHDYFYLTEDCHLLLLWELQKFQVRDLMTWEEKKFPYSDVTSPKYINGYIESLFC